MSPTVGQPFHDQTIVLVNAGLGAKRAEVEILAIESDPSLHAGFVLALLGACAKTVCTVVATEEP